jgi:tRNA A37 threonylcarbamoyltransferase TsaD
MMLAKLLTKAQNGLPYPGGPLIDKYAQLETQKPLLLQNQKFKD